MNFLIFAVHSEDVVQSENAREFEEPADLEQLAGSKILSYLILICASVTAHVMVWRCPSVCPYLRTLQAGYRPNL
jgi:hypothetical protein